MSENTKIQFSAAELELLQDKKIILTKRSASEKIILLLEELQNDLKTALLENPPGIIELETSVPKITRGENYNALPYFVLDYPASFRKTNYLALRTIVLWADTISVQLLCSKANNSFHNIKKNKESLPAEYLIGIAKDPWVHENNAENFAPIHKANIDFDQVDFIKISRHFPILDAIKKPEDILRAACALLKLLKD